MILPHFLSNDVITLAGNEILIDTSITRVTHFTFIWMNYFLRYVLGFSWRGKKTVIFF